VKACHTKRFSPKTPYRASPIYLKCALALLSPFDPDRAGLRAGRLMLQEIKRRAQAGESFAFETTLAGRNYARLIPRWRAAGYHVELIFLSLPSADVAVVRVAARVAQGGHNIPEEIIRRRFDAGLRNFERLYQKLVDTWALYNNSESTPRLIVSKDNA
ncbi:MAG: zeta toxin family protein, partial [Sedimentisphaerales bacterium]|nr:zeta toxin family protein [Sedimentisphaerales bacterium]